MSGSKLLNIGMVGYGFMGRTHSNAFRQAARFFDLEYEPVGKAVCGRNGEQARSFAGCWGYEFVETDWRRLHSDQGIVRGWRSIHVTDSGHPYMEHWWVPGLQIGYEHTFIHQAADFLAGLASGNIPGPAFREGLATDYVTDAVLKSAANGAWEAVKAVQVPVHSAADAGPKG
jgi:predicted dehydrogenase